MISWLNKQLNEKPGIGSGMLPPSFKATTTTIVGNGMSKPPVSATTSSFKPTFASLEQLNSTNNERSPFRNISTPGNNNNLLSTPSSVSSMGGI